MRTWCIVFLLVAAIASGQTLHPYHISKLELVGSSLWQASEIRSQFATQDTLREAILESDISHLLERYAAAGYPFARITIERLQPTDSVDIEIRLYITEGKLAHLSGCTVRGLKETDTSVVSREFFLSSNPVATREVLTNGVSHLRETGLLASVSDAALYPITDSTVGVELFVEESRSTSIDGILGYNPSPIPTEKAYITGILDLGFTNIGGSARQAAFHYERLRPVSSDLHFQYKEPWLFSMPVDGTIALQRYNEDSLYTSTHLEAGFTLHSLIPVSLGLSGAYDVVSPSPASGILHSNILSGTLTMSIDERNDRIAPSKGYRIALGASYGSKNTTDSLGFSSIASIRTLTAEAEGELGLGISQLIGILGISAQQVTSATLELPDLFRIGGINSLRGYRDASYLVSQYAIAKLEVRYMLTSHSFIGLFTDIGYLNRPETDLFAPATAYPVGYGLSMLFDTQIGYVKVAVAIAKGESLDQSLLHFGLKTAL
ncbi:MAG TPA: BamA/TamA family outer membrane protein [Candidatus Kapabacteria bacterium]|nr:BamA/TamA family outer membrane protein [Candidatus Kapabacteria bacterium]